MNAPNLKRDGKKSVKKELREPEEMVKVGFYFLKVPVPLLYVSKEKQFFKSVLWIRVDFTRFRILAEVKPCFGKGKIFLHKIYVSI